MAFFVATGAQLGVNRISRRISLIAGVVIVGILAAIAVLSMFWTP